MVQAKQLFVIVQLWCAGSLKDLLGSCGVLCVAVDFEAQGSGYAFEPPESTIALAINKQVR